MPGRPEGLPAGFRTWRRATRARRQGRHGARWAGGRSHVSRDKSRPTVKTPHFKPRCGMKHGKAGANVLGSHGTQRPAGGDEP